MNRQYAHIQNNFPDAVIFFKVGCYFEFYRKKSQPVAELLKLSRLKPNRRGARYGFPVNLMDRYLKTLLDHKKAALIVLEDGVFGKKYGKGKYVNDTSHCYLLRSKLGKI